MLSRQIGHHSHSLRDNLRSFSPNGHKDKTNFSFPQFVSLGKFVVEQVIDNFR